MLRELYNGVQHANRDQRKKTTTTPEMTELVEPKRVMLPLKELAQVVFTQMFYILRVESRHLEMMVTMFEIFFRHDESLCSPGSLSDPPPPPTTLIQSQSSKFSD